MSDEPNNPGVWPALVDADAEAARTFLTGVFGFTETLTIRDDDSHAIVHGELGWPEGGGAMYGTHRPNREDGLPQPTGINWVYVVTGDPDAVYHRAVDAGAKIVQEPYDADYGSRNVAIADPEGNVWTFGTYHGS